MADSSWDIIDLVHIPPPVNHILNVFINIYEYAKLDDLHMQQRDNMPMS